MFHPARLILPLLLFCAPAGALGGDSEGELVQLEVPLDVARAPGVSGNSGVAVPLGTSPSVAVDPATGILMATIGRPGNPADTSGLGAVPYRHRMAVYEVTNTQYVEFLNAVAAADPHDLFNQSMTDSDRGGILRSGTSGSFSYSIKTHFEQKPANFVSWYDAARFCNWLHNGKPVGVPSSTESGVYDMTLPGAALTRGPGAKYFVPSHDEWYKAAYYDPFDPGADAGGTEDYWLYPTQADAVPTKAQANAVGDVTNPGPNVANLDRGANWNGENGNVTTVGGTLALNAWGTFDMAGNINEPTDESGPPIPPDNLPTRRIRGGDFANAEILASSPPGFAGALNMEAEGANVGFRIAAFHCPLPDEPANLLLDRDGADVILSWDDPVETVSWNVYRDTTPDRSLWGSPLESGVTDEDPGTSGIQFRDVGAVIDPEPLFYLVTASNPCGESPLD